jgi:hypothetical protein
MDPWLLLLLGLGAIALALWWPRWRLRRALAQPFPDAWVEILERNIGVYRSLPRELRLQLRQLIKRFLHEKTFTGAGGLVIDDEIRVTIAAQACMLVLHRGARVYPGLRYIIVYPAAFVARHDAPDELGLVRSGGRGLLGESWANGKVILAWDSVLSGASNFADGHNVVLHEFAHQLDSETGSTNGAPLLAGASSYRSWSRAFSAEFEVLQRDARIGRQSLLDHYGASNPAELFAVATETFFEQPDSMARHHAELFGLLCDYYRIDPRDWRAHGL